MTASRENSSQLLPGLSVVVPVYYSAAMRSQLATRRAQAVTQPDPASR